MRGGRLNEGGYQQSAQKGTWMFEPVPSVPCYYYKTCNKCLVSIKRRGVFVVVVAVDVVVIVVLVVVLVIVVVVAICTNKRCVYNKCWSPINTLVYLSNVLINSLAFITARGSDGSIVSS